MRTLPFLGRASHGSSPAVVIVVLLKSYSKLTPATYPEQPVEESFIAEIVREREGTIPASWEGETTRQLVATFATPLQAAYCAVTIQTRIGSRRLRHHAEIGIAMADRTDQAKSQAAGLAAKGRASDIFISSAIRNVIEQSYPRDDIAEVDEDTGTYELLYGDQRDRLNAPFDRMFAAEIEGWIQHRNHRTKICSPERPDARNELRGLALSGGGMRSGTFCLGVLQALADANKLEQFDYISSVSGGGYAGSALQAMCTDQRAAIDLADPGLEAFDVTAEHFPFSSARPIQSTGDGGPETYSPVHGEEAPALREIREQANLLGRGFGLFGIEMWTALSRYLVSTTLLLLLFVFPALVLLAEALMLPPESETARLWWDRRSPFETLSFTALPWLLVVVAGTGLAAHLMLSLVNVYAFNDFNNPERFAHRWITRLQRALLSAVGAATLLLLTVLAIWAAHAAVGPLGTRAQHRIVAAISAAGFTGVVAALAAVAQILKPGAIPGTITKVAMAVGGYVVLIGGFAIAYGVLWSFARGQDIPALRGQDITALRDFGTLELIACVTGAIFLLSVLVPPSVLNWLSLGDLYRFRIERTWVAPAKEYGPEPGFRPLSRLFRQGGLTVTDLNSPTPRAPYPLICCALNFPGDTSEKLLDRKSDSFVIAPLYSGSQTTRWLPTADLPSLRKMSLGEAASISGAAVSPNMGQYTQVTLSIAMTLLNVRLGRWIISPMRRTHWLAPKWTLFYYWEEMLGRARRSSKLIYLSDGGHFENLGVYELFRRRCKTIVVVDATGDSLPPERLSFGSLANALRLARVDFGIEVSLDVRQVDHHLRTGLAKSYLVEGTIKYPGDGNGKFIMVKPALVEPGLTPDIIGYARKTNPRFPHDSTLDQQFDQPQFESYRHLGYLAGTALCSSAVKREEPSLE